jgi:hypothetical protein
MTTRRRLPAPWRAEKMPGGYVVSDSNDHAIAYIYCRANERFDRNGELEYRVKSLNEPHERIVKESELIAAE